MAASATTGPPAVAAVDRRSTPRRIADLRIGLQVRHHSCGRRLALRWCRAGRCGCRGQVGCRNRSRVTFSRLDAKIGERPFLWPRLRAGIGHASRFGLCLGNFRILTGRIAQQVSQGDHQQHDDEAADTDLKALEAGFVSLTPIWFDLTHDAVLPDFRKVWEES